MDEREYSKDTEWIHGDNNGFASAEEIQRAKLERQQRSETEIAQAEQVGEASLEAAGVEVLSGVFKIGDEVKVARNIKDADGNSTGQKTAPESGWKIIMVQGDRVVVGNDEGKQKGVRLSDLEAWNQPDQEPSPNPKSPDVQEAAAKINSYDNLFDPNYDAGSVESAAVVPEADLQAKARTAADAKYNEVMNSTGDSEAAQAAADRVWKGFTVR